MKEIPKSEWEHIENWNEDTEVIKVFISDKYLVQVRKHGNSIRLSINRNDGMIRQGRLHWKDGITWDQLQQIKNECGFTDRWMVEYFPPENELVNVANFRHLWLLEEEPKNHLNCLNGIKRLVDKDKDPS